MRLGPVVVVVVLLSCVVGAAIAASSGNFDVTIDGATDVPDRTVTYENETYVIGSVGTVGTGEDLVVDASVPSGRSHSVNLYEDKSGVEVAFSSGTGPTTHTFDSSEVDEIGPGTYAVALVDDGDVEAFTLAVIEGYDLSAMAPEEVALGTDETVTISVEQTRLDDPPASVRLGFDADGEEVIVDAEQVEAGTYEASIPTEELGLGTHDAFVVALDDDGEFTDEEVLAAEAIGDIEVVEADPSVSVQTSGTTNVTSSSMVATGELTELQDLDEATVFFEYGPAEEEFTSTTASETMTSTGSFETTIDGLEPGTEYQIRAVAEAENASATGEAVTVTTGEAGEDPRVSVTTAAPSTVGSSSAVLSGSVTELNGTESATVAFEYGPAGEGFSTTTASETVTGTGSFETRIDGLEPETEYQVRAVAEAENASATGEAVTFTTAADDGVQVAVRTADPTAVEATTARLSGSVTEINGTESATVYLEYGPAGEGFSATTASETVSGTESFGATVEELIPETEYQVRAVVEAGNASAVGATVSFTTPASEDGSGYGSGGSDGDGSSGDTDGENGTSDGGAGSSSGGGTDGTDGSEDGSGGETNDNESGGSSTGTDSESDTDGDSETGGESGAQDPTVEQPEGSSDDQISLPVVVPLVAILLAAGVLARRRNR